MATLIGQIKECIEQKLDAGFRKFIIFPFGDVGMQVKEVLRHAYGIEAEYVLDNKLCKYNSDIKSLEFLDKFSLGGVLCCSGMYKFQDIWRVEERTTKVCSR